jgi:sugar phosphate isomerase/epimerase
MTLRDLSLNLATVREQFNLREAVEACVRHGIGAIDPWRDQVQKQGIEESARIIKDHAMRVTGLCRGGFFPAADASGRQAAIDDNKRALDEASAIGAECLVLVVGGLPEGSRDIAGARTMVSEGIDACRAHAKAVGVPLAIEPLHPMYAADRACVNTLAQALDMCDQLGPDVGVAIDVYHLWWDPNFEADIARAGRGKRILAYHICDWLVPTRDMLLDRGMMGDGVIDLKRIRRAIEEAGYNGPQEVEILSSRWWSRPGDEVIATCVQRFHEQCIA